LFDDFCCTCVCFRCNLHKSYRPSTTRVQTRGSSQLQRGNHLLDLLMEPTAGCVLGTFHATQEEAGAAAAAAAAADAPAAAGTGCMPPPPARVTVKLEKQPQDQQGQPQPQPKKRGQQELDDSDCDVEGAGTDDMDDMEPEDDSSVAKGRLSRLQGELRLGRGGRWSCSEGLTCDEDPTAGSWSSPPNPRNQCWICSRHTRLNVVTA
jgi:hypothetical protein